jgi:hypothetical protein
MIVALIVVAALAAFMLALYRMVSSAPICSCDKPDCGGGCV